MTASGQQMSATPTVDHCLGTSFRSFGELGQWARTIERTARELESSLTARVASGDPSAIAIDARAAIQHLIDPSSGGLIVRTLQRPGQHLAHNSGPRRALTVRADSAFAVARAALELQPLIDEVQAEVAELSRRFAGDLPTLLQEHLVRARLSPERVHNLRRTQSVAAAQHRLARVRNILEQYSQELPSDRPDEAAALDAAAARGTLTLRELRGVYAIAKRRRRMLETKTTVDVHMRSVSQHLVDAQAACSKTTPLEDVAAQVLEELAKLALDIDAAAFRGGSDLPVWVGIFAAGHNAAFPRSSRYGWRPPSGSLGSTAAVEPLEEELEPSHRSAAWYAVPMINGYVCLTHEPSSAIRVWSRGISVGTTVECTLDSESDTIDHPVLALHDIPAFFLNFDPVNSAWYRAMSRAKVEVIAADDGERWFGRMIERGTLEVSEQLPWRDERGGASAVRVLLEARPTVQSADSESHDSARDSGVVVHSIGLVSHFLGVENRWIRTPYSGQRKAIMRVPTARTGRDTAAVAHEREFFQHISLESGKPGRRASLSAPKLVTDAVLRRGGALWPVYAMPFGLPFDSAPMIDRWMRQNDDSRIGALQSVAWCLLKAHAFGFALGICHSACFSFTARWPRLDHAPVPDVGLYRAPAATRFGDTFAPLPQFDAADTYAFIGIDPVPPAVRARVVAHQHVDALAFGAFMLDLLAKEKLPTHEDLSWRGLSHAVKRLAATHFWHPLLATSLADKLGDPSGPAALWDVLRTLATAKNLEFKTLVESL